MVSPGLRMPALSASSTIRKLILSFTLPPALKYSHLATTNTQQKHFDSESWNYAIDLEWPSFVALIMHINKKQILWYNTSDTTTPVFTWCQWLTHNQQSHLLSDMWMCLNLNTPWLTYFAFESKNFGDLVDAHKGSVPNPVQDVWENGWGDGSVRREWEKTKFNKDMQRHRLWYTWMHKSL